MIMAILSGNDAGGGVIWAPQVIEDAADHRLVLAETGKLYDTKKGEHLPDGVVPMQKLTEDEANVRFPTPARCRSSAAMCAAIGTWWRLLTKGRSK